MEAYPSEFCQNMIDTEITKKNDQLAKKQKVLQDKFRSDLYSEFNKTFVNFKENNKNAEDYYCFQFSSLLNNTSRETLLKEIIERFSYVYYYDIKFIEPSWKQITTIKNNLQHNDYRICFYKN